MSETIPASAVETQNQPAAKESELPPLRRRICLFSDGTGNSSSKLFKTNVWRLYDALNFEDVDQIAYYDNGVGTSAFAPLAILGGAFGIGLTRNVKNIYAFLCRNYRPGDDIYCFGFSRGAFTIRVLLALIESEGLVKYDPMNPHAEAQLEADADEAFRHYAAKRNRYGILTILHQGIRHIFTIFKKVLETKFKSPLQPYNQAGNWWQVDEISMQAFTLENCPTEINETNPKSHIPVKFVGLWDTVSAYGLPIDELTRAWDKFFWPLSYDTKELPASVRRACHAIAIDEERNTFRPDLWNGGTSAIRADFRSQYETNQSPPPVEHERITQVWFAGAHSNVGGGYPDDSLSYVSLDWMIDELAQEGQRDRIPGRAPIEFDTDKRNTIGITADSCGTLRDSRKGFASYYRYKPRDIDELNRESCIISLPKIHYTVFERIWIGADGYVPFNLPQKFLVVDRHKNLIDPWSDLRVLQAAGLPENDWNNALRTRTKIQDYVWDFVWSKRLVYYVTLAVTLFLIAMPYMAGAAQEPAKSGSFLTDFWVTNSKIWPGENAGACLSQSWFCPVSKIMDWLSPFLPLPFHKWLRTYQSNPGITLLAIALIFWLNGTSKKLSIRIRDLIRPVLRQFDHIVESLETNPKVALSKWRTTELTPESWKGLENDISSLRKGHHRIINSLRKLRSYKTFWKTFNQITPVLFCGLVFYLMLAFTVKSLSSIVEASGGTCTQTSPPSLLSPERKRSDAAKSSSLDFQISDPCFATGYTLEQGATYEISITIPETSPWIDGNMRAGLYGVIPERANWWRAIFGTPFSRHFGENWLKPIARVGKYGNDTYPLNPATSINDNPQIYKPYSTGENPEPNTEPLNLVTTIVARTSGELFLYVNDIGLGALPNVDQWLDWISPKSGFYSSNRGRAAVTVHKIP